MEYMTARAQPTPKAKPKKNPMIEPQKMVMASGYVVEDYSSSPKVAERVTRPARRIGRSTIVM
jgi:hypothetical protein